MSMMPTADAGTDVADVGTDVASVPIELSHLVRAPLGAAREKCLG